ncbi:MAG: hypothetical protein HKL81_02265 [Acidimicrobiaceae bacterium]|nr:hypothetical protein [Acidimicrobiaceae bacterium]
MESDRLVRLYLLGEVSEVGIWFSDVALTLCRSCFAVEPLWIHLSSEEIRLRQY